MSYQLVYQDPFDQIDTSKWEIHSDAQYMIVDIQQDPDNANNNVLHTKSIPDTTNDIARIVWIGSQLTKPVKIVIKVRNVSDTNPSKGNSICIARDNNGYIYFVNVNPSGNWVAIARIIESQLGTGTPPETLQQFDISNLGLSMDQWYTLEIELTEDNTINITINGQQVGSYTLNVDVTPYVHLGAVEGGETLYDDFQLYQVQQQVEVNEVPLTDIAYVEEQEVTQPHFTITDYTQSVTVQPNEQFNINVTIINDGNASGTVEVRLRDPNGSIVDSKQVTLNAGEQSTIQLTATAPSQEGTYNYTVEAYNVDTGNTDDSKTVTVNVQQVAQPHFTIIDYTQSITVSPNATFNVNVTVKNDGNADGDVTVRLKDTSGSVVDSRTITLSAGQQSTVTLSAVAPSSVGTYTYTVEAYNETTQTVDDTKTVTVNVQQPTVTKAEFPWWILLLLLLLLLLLGSSGERR